MYTSGIAEPNNTSTRVVRVRWAGGGPEHRFWPGKGECGQYTTRFAVRGSLATRALVSYPGSGNTWIRYLIEAATGVYTGSVFRDKSILSAGHHGEMRDPRDGSTVQSVDGLKIKHKNFV